MAMTKIEAERQDVSVDHPDLLTFVKDGIAALLRAVAEKGFRLPLRFRMVDAHGDLLREFRIHKDGLELNPPTGKPNNLYIFPLTASVRDAAGRRARVRLRAEGAGAVEFVN